MLLLLLVLVLCSTVKILTQPSQVHSSRNGNGYEEGRNPSGGYGYTRGSSNGVRDSTVVM